MSVAFRRDGDEEHLEPKFEVPIPPGPNRVTPQGAAQIDERLAHYEALVAAGGEETALTAAKRDLRYWRQRKAGAELMPPADGQAVAFGTRVTFRLGGQVRTIRIVGHDEADVSEGKIAFTAPLPRAMMDAEVGEFADFNGKVDAIEVLEIAPL
ncbi:GreA/GreB family elongation factor [Novosphingobium sp. KCTC 2891]|uniref:GreA/GreB family elongation factor n=1 Tax=Novosphingobium sp. KCTC 2891 TaxID=2989730 RepID=UPI0022216256|nr:GreA/GreB family elongation factor [Novosphingobium sp. KCTC 2891]MCW1383033.1 GreA/GreB family elongation factor [Novosphingobium sp. KCTC 2891]